MHFAVCGPGVSLRGQNEHPVLSDFAFSDKTSARNEAPQWSRGQSPVALTDGVKNAAVGSCKRQVF